MAFNVTVTLKDGSTRVYADVPNTITPDEVEARAAKEFGQPVSSLEGWQGDAAQPVKPAAPAVEPVAQPQAAVTTPTVQPAPPPAPEAPKVQTPGTLKGLAQQASQGALFNFTDELLGLASPDAKEKFRRESEQFAKERPWASMGAQTAGAMLPFALTRGKAGKLPIAAEAGSVTQNLVAPALTGAISGAVAGAGEGESLPERARNMGIQALVGALATPTMHAAGNLASGVGRSVAGLFSDTVAAKQGVNMLAKTMRDEGLDPNVIQRMVAEQTTATGKPVMLLDMIDPDKYPKTYDLVSRGLTQGTDTAAKMSVIDRAKDTTKRLVEDVGRRISPRSEQTLADLRSSKELRSAEWKSAFDKVKDIELKSPAIDEILSRPFARDAIAGAVENARNAGDTQALALFKRHLAIDPATNQYVIKANPTVELVQQIKNLGYTPALSAAFKGAPIKGDTGTIMKQQRDLLAAVDSAVPEYATLRGRFAESKDIDNARELGANIQSYLTKGIQDEGGKVKGLKSQQIIDEYHAMSGPEKKAFQHGLASTMVQNVRNKATGTSMQYGAVIGEPGNLQSSKVLQLKAIMGDNTRFKNFLDRLGAEKKIETAAKAFAGVGSDGLGGESLARNAVRIGGAAALGRPAAAIPGVAGQVEAFLKGVRPKTVQPMGTIAAQTAAPSRQAGPLVDLLKRDYSDLSGVSMNQLSGPLATSGLLRAGAGVMNQQDERQPPYRRGGLAQATR